MVQESFWSLARKIRHGCVVKQILVRDLSFRHTFGRVLLHRLLLLLCLWVVSNIGMCNIHSMSTYVRFIFSVFFLSSLSVYFCLRAPWTSFLVPPKVLDPPLFMRSRIMTARYCSRCTWSKRYSLRRRMTVISVHFMEIFSNCKCSLQAYFQWRPNKWIAIYVWWTGSCSPVKSK